MLIPRLVRELTLDPRQHPRGCGHLSAVSGLVQTKGRTYLVADDEQHLAVFDASAGDASSLSLLRVLDGDLPQGKAARKKAKADLESLALLPAFPAHPHGALLALGSGSRPTRQRAVLLPLDAHGVAQGQVARIDCATLYGNLRVRFPDLNIEGAFVAGAALHLLQRGNRGDARNARISLDWTQVVPWLASQHLGPPAVTAVQTLPLPDQHGVPLGLTDGSALDDGSWVFCAVAEDTSDSYRDGGCVGSAVGRVGPDGSLLDLHLLQGSPKVEGIAATRRAGKFWLTLVTDPDDPEVASRVLEVELPPGRTG
jgi:hypothetical protein